MPAGLTRQDLIIIIVCCAVGAIISCAILWRCLRSRCRNNSAPLPPVQPLAHHREQLLARLEHNRSATWYEPTLRPLGNFTPGNSKTSLLIPDSPNITISENSASNHDEEMKTLSPLDPHFSVTSNNPGPSPSNPVDDIKMASRSANNTPQSKWRRPMSVVSVQSSTRRSIRGTPHAPRNQIQIILPAPLAPETHPYLKSNGHSPAQSRSVSRYDDGSDHLSPADKWVTPVSRSSSPMGSRKPSDTDEPRKSISSVSSNSHRSSEPRVVRSASRSPSSRSTPPTYLRPVSPPEMPPVPPMPSINNTRSIVASSAHA